MSNSVEPFGLTTAELVEPRTPAEAHGLQLCPARQITVTGDGTPFIHNPSMKSEFLTQSQTREDHQLATDTENDRD